MCCPVPDGKPFALSVDFNGVPEEWANLKRWLVWKCEFSEGGWKKVPYGSDGKQHGFKTPRHWMWLSQVRKLYETGGYDGIMIAFGPDEDQYAFIDLDPGLDNMKGVSERFNSYTEKSTSGKGLHVYIRATTRHYGHGKKNHEIEVYPHSKLVVVTGHGNGLTINPRQAELDTLVAEQFPEDTQPARKDLVNIVSPCLTDEEILEKMFRQSDGDNLRRLYEGHRDGDASAEDYRIARAIAFYTQNVEQMERLMFNSSLVREKWNRQDRTHGTWILATIHKALGGRHTFYTRSVGQEIQKTQIAHALPRILLAPGKGRFNQFVLAFAVANKAFERRSNEVTLGLRWITGLGFSRGPAYKALAELKAEGWLKGGETGKFGTPYVLGIPDDGQAGDKGAALKAATDGEGDHFANHHGEGIELPSPVYVSILSSVIQAPPCGSRGDGITVRFGAEQTSVLVSDVWLPPSVGGLGRGCECVYLLLATPLPEATLLRYFGRNARQRYLVPMEQVRLIDAHEEDGVLMWRRCPVVNG